MVGKRIAVGFYRSPSGQEPVRDWLRELSRKDRLTIGTDIKTVEYGWPIGMPTCRPLSGGLWEVRSDLSHGRIARVIFMIDDARMILLVAFIKKTQKTPDDQLQLARSRKREVES